MAQKLFPDDFLWGASTSGHQVEGGNYDQWTVWELAHAAGLAETAADRLRWLPGWLKIKNQAVKPENYVSGRGVEHRAKFKEDFALLKKLNLNSLRFGIEWSRVEPDRGVWDKQAIDYYHNYIAELKWFVKGGYSVPEALIAATRTNAALLDMADKLGTLEPGKLADVIVVNGRPDQSLDDLAKVDVVIKGGYVVVKDGVVQVPRHVAAPLPKPSPPAAVH